MMWQNLRCGLSAGPVTAGCGLNCNLRGGLWAQFFRPRRALVYAKPVGDILNKPNFLYQCYVDDT